MSQYVCKGILPAGTFSFPVILCSVQFLIRSIYVLKGLRSSVSTIPFYPLVSENPPLFSLLPYHAIHRAR